MQLSQTIGIEFHNMPISQMQSGHNLILSKKPMMESSIQNNLVNNIISSNINNGISNYVQSQHYINNAGIIKNSIINNNNYNNITNHSNNCHEDEIVEKSKFQKQD